MPTLTEIIKDILRLPCDALVYELSERLARLYPDKYILETDDCSFEFEEFVKAGRCLSLLRDDPHPQLEADWYGKDAGAQLGPRTAFVDVRWKGERLSLLRVAYGDCDHRYFIIADSAGLAKEFFVAVAGFTNEVQGEILVFNHGYWQRDKQLHDQIKSSSLDGLVLTDELRQTLVSDFEGFFQARDIYDDLGVAWKRGILLLGPPGNGKTHAIKAMVQRLGKPCLYVRSLRRHRRTPQESIQAIYHRARQVAPCLLVFEDLDTIIDEGSRSYLLNEMDGFASNRGILTVATTNHPDRLDPALLDRPSRFDRKITFTLPAAAERRRFLSLADERQPEAMRISLEGLDRLVEDTDGFSFAYLKELRLSGTMAWVAQRKAGGMAEAMLEQVAPLRAQMSSQPVSQKPVEDEDDD